MSFQFCIHHPLTFPLHHSVSTLKHRGGCSNYESIKLDKYESQEECERRCASTTGCKEFIYNEASGKCSLLNGECAKNDDADVVTYKMEQG